MAESNSLPRRFQFGLGTIFLVVTVCALAAGWFAGQRRGYVEYKSLSRKQVEGLATGLSGPTAPGMNIAALDSGLAQLGRDGWELAGIEPAYTRDFGGGASMHFEPTYVFKRRH